MPPDRGRRPRTLAGVISAAWPVTQHVSFEYQVSGISLRAQSAVRRDKRGLPSRPKPADMGPDA